MDTSINLAQFKTMIEQAAAIIKERQEVLTKIDGRFGDGDHGITMSKVADVINAGADGNTIAEYCDDLGMRMMCINGGSASSLWGTLFSGFASAGTGERADSKALKHILRCGLDELCSVSTARVGDKTMMDALIPAVTMAEKKDGPIEAVLTAAADASRKGMKDTENMISKYGRAKSYGEKTLGTPDAGAVSMSYFFEGLLKGYEMIKDK